MNNVIMKVEQRISPKVEREARYKLMYNLLSEIDAIYSVIVYYKQEEKVFVVQYNIAENDDYNTVKTQDVVDKVNRCIEDYDGNERVAGYIQPPIEICLEVYNPLVLKLAKRQYRLSRYFDEEDYAQMCRLVMIRLHKKGYYINKRLLEKAFNNEVLMALRRVRSAPIILSFEDTFFTPLSNSSEKLLVADTIEDASLREEEENARISEAERLIFEEVKDIIVDKIGIRQWNELVRDYTHEHTTSWSQKKMHEVKHYMKSLGLTRKDFNNKYYG